MSILFKIILSLSFSGTMLIILLFLLKPLYKDRIGKRWQYYMWMIVIVRLLVPFTLSTSLVKTLFREADRMMVQITTASGEDITYALQTHNLRGEENTAADSGSFHAEAGSSAVASQPLQRTWAAALINNLWLVWLLGALLLLIRKIAVYQGFVKHVKAECIEVSDVDLLNLLAQYGEQAGVRAPVELYINSCISSPMLIGFFRPCIILRTADLSESDLQYTLLHELTHYRHRDMFYKWIVQVTLCLHWFNPFVYLMCREINRACELSCDETIISRLGKKERETYGDMLMNAVGAGGVVYNSMASMTLYENKKMIKERLRAIMDFKKKSVWTTLGAFVLMVSLFAVSAAMGAYAVPAAAEGKTEEGTASLTIGDERGETDTLTITDSMVSDLAYIAIIQDGGEYCILCKGGPRDHAAGITDGTALFMIVRENEFVYAGPFEVTERLVDEVTEQCSYMSEENSEVVSQGEVSLLIQAAAKIQSGDDSGFITRNGWSTGDDDITSILIREYRKWCAKMYDTYYFQDERTSSLNAPGTDGSEGMNYDADRDVNTQANPFDSGTDSGRTEQTSQAGIFAAADLWNEVSAIYMAAKDGMIIADLVNYRFY